MTDLFEEVEEQLRSDRYKALARKGAPWVIAAAAVALVIALGIWGWQQYNQQITDKTVNGNHITEGITTNALAFDFAGFPGVSGTIDIGQSAASISETVPEPSTWAMMALGFVGLAFVSWRGRKLAAVR